MVHIDLKNVYVDFPIYGITDQSIKHAMLTRGTTGGNIRSDGNVKIVRALEDITLSITAGDRVALVGHNGAGKSTLLRVMAGIYEPTDGTANIEGKVTAMFETAMGIRPNATGVENMRTRGILLGLDDRQIAELIEEARSSSGLGEFIDLPVRTYSAGMRMRLIFAVTTFGASDILLIDEAIVTGDQDFKVKAKKRVDKVMEEAKIIVLTSHSKELMYQMCDKGILLSKGTAKVYDSLDELYFEYERVENELL